MKRVCTLAMCILPATALAETKSRKVQTNSTERLSQEIQGQNSVPLAYEIGIVGSIENQTSEDSYSDSKSNKKTKSKSFTLGGLIYRIVGNFEVGPTFSYYRNDTSYTYEDPTRTSSPNTWISYSGGVNFKYNFADVQIAAYAPFAEFAYSRSLTKFFSSSSSNTVHFGFGVSWFVLRNIALTPVIKYSIENGDHGATDYGEAYKNKDTAIDITWGLSNFI